MRYYVSTFGVTHENKQIISGMNLVIDYDPFLDCNITDRLVKDVLNYKKELKDLVVLNVVPLKN